MYEVVQVGELGLVGEVVRLIGELRKLPKETQWVEFKINNSYRAYVARQLIADHPHLGKLLETRIVNHGPEAFLPGNGRRVA